MKVKQLHQDTLDIFGKNWLDQFDVITNKEFVLCKL